MLKQVGGIFLAVAGLYAEDRAFTNARVIDGTGRPPMERAVIIVRDGRIAFVGHPRNVRADQILDLSGKTVIPGLISAHVHISDVQGLKPPAYTDENTLRQLGVYARYGITSLWSLGGEQAPAFRARESQNTASLDRSRLYLAGEIVNAGTPDEARQAVARVAATKPDILKIRVDDQLGTTQKMKPEVYRAVIDEAHKRKLRVAAHIFYLNDAKDLLRAGVDMIAHSVRDKDIDAEFISLMKARNVPYCPTLTREVSTFAYGAKPQFFSDPFFLREADRAVVAQLSEPARQEAMRNSRAAKAYKAALPVALRNLKKAADAGLLIVMGTDSGAAANRFQGYFEHLEMQMMAEAGLTPMQIVRSATSDAARAMKMPAIGTIEKGSHADFVVLDRDPLSDIRNTTSINSVWIAGNEVKR